jgi:hypothetical protein
MKCLQDSSHALSVRTAQILNKISNAISRSTICKTITSNVGSAIRSSQVLCICRATFDLIIIIAVLLQNLFLEQLFDFIGHACVVCGIRVKGSGLAFKKHLEKHNVTRSHWVRCDECGRWYPGLLTLYTHLRDVHSQSRRCGGV